MRLSKIFLVGLILLATRSSSVAQTVSPSSGEVDLGVGKVELGGFPGGGTFFIGGDDLQEANFNVYTFGGGITYYLTSKLGLEGEFTSSVGIAQDVFFNRAKFEHVQVPDVWSYSGNIVFIPRESTGKRFLFYLTGGVGAISLEPRTQTKPFGYDMARIGWQTFITENVGGGIKFFRAADAPNWGFRADYRYVIINENDNAPAFFASAKSRGAQRVYLGMLYTWKR